MSNKLSGIVAGLAATVVLSVLMLMKVKMGLMPELDVIAMLSGMMGTSHIVGWIAHFMLGTIVFGLAFAMMYPHLPGGSAISKGVAFSIGAWLVMMSAVMPTAGAGFFGLSLGIMAPVMTLMLHLIFGVVLGFTYAQLAASSAHSAV